MSDSAHIRLPLTTPSQYLLLAVAAAFGAVEREGLGDFDAKCRRHHELDLSQPCSSTNTWHLSVVGSLQSFWFEARGGADFGQGRLIFHDSAGQKHDWLFLMEEESETRRCLIADSDALTVALGERLVRLFGGEMVYNSRSDEERIFKVRRPSVVFPKPTGAEMPDSNAMFYLLQNTVGSTPPLTAKELRDAAARASYGIETPTIRTLLAALDAQALHTELNSTLDAGQPARRAARM